MAQSTLGIRHATKQSEPKKKPSLRPDIQGLRALAVLLVIADHLFQFPTGGFVGVDVFFVISGFLITGLLIREHASKGRISFADFYRRRALRILPLAILVLVTTAAASWAIFTTSRALDVGKDALWSLVFGANWHFALIGTNYMENDGTVSPLQHFWSLAVEEQFYVVWPWLIILILGAAATALRLSPARARLALAVAMLVVTVASFAFAMWETSASPTFAYFSTFSRAWELGLGALLATLAPALHRLPDALRPVIAYVGLAGILAGAFVLTPDSPFPGPWAALPVISTVLVIAAGTGRQPRFLTPLSNRVTGYLGDISYSLYLWHFPAIVLLAALNPDQTPLDKVMVFGIVIALSTLSYFFLEDPMRHSGWLQPRKGKNRKDSSQSDQRLTYGALIALGMVSVLVAGVAMAKTAPSEGPPVSVPRPMPTASGSAVPATAAAIQTAKIEAALASVEWPELKPSIDELKDTKAPEWVEDGCLALETKSIEDPQENAQHCVYGNANAAKTAVIIGDSMAISYVHGIRAALEPQGYKIQLYTMMQCPSVSVTVLKTDKSRHPQCDSFRQWAFDEVARTKPDIVFLTSHHGATLAASSPDFVSQWSEGSAKTFTALSGSAQRIIVIDAPPGGKSLTSCATRASKPNDCQTSVPERYNETMRAVRQGALTLGGAAKIEFLDSRAWFCAQACPAFVGTVPVYADGAHLTSAFSTSLGPVIAEAIAKK